MPKTIFNSCLINEKCLDTFFSKDTFHTLSKFIVPLATAFVLAVISYGFIYANVTIKQESRLIELENHYQRLDSTINKKLDVLIQRSEK